MFLSFTFFKVTIYTLSYAVIFSSTLTLKACLAK